MNQVVPFLAHNCMHSHILLCSCPMPLPLPHPYPPASSPRTLHNTVLLCLQALIDDLLDHRLNRVTVDLPSKDGKQVLSSLVSLLCRIYFILLIWVACFHPCPSPLSFYVLFYFSFLWKFCSDPVLLCINFLTSFISVLLCLTFPSSHYPH